MPKCASVFHEVRMASNVLKRAAYGVVIAFLLNVPRNQSIVPNDVAVLSIIGTPSRDLLGRDTVLALWWDSFRYIAKLALQVFLFELVQ